MQTTESKVSRQWRKAKGKMLAFSAGFSWRPRSAEDADDDPAKVVNRETPSDKLQEGEQRSRARIFVAVVLVLLLGGITAIVVTQMRKDKEVEADSLF